ncbi:MAG: flagellar biosynthetic protein FliO [Pseudomonadota bacterium]
MTSAATLLLLAAALGAPEPVDLAPPPELGAAPATLEAGAPEPGASAEVPLPPVAVVAGAEPGPATTGGPGDPLYERLFGSTEATVGAEQHRTLPTMPAWLWLASGGGLVGLYLWRQRKKGEEAGPGQIEILGHTRVGPKARLTVVRVAGADGVPRRLLLSTGEGAPALVTDLGTERAPAASAPAAPAPTFAQALDGALSTSLAQAPAEITAATDEALIDPPATDDAGVIPPPRVPVWNETPDEYRAARREPRPRRPWPSPRPRIRWRA